jgi:hypothetical protein
MSYHQRKQIRDAVIDALKRANTVAGSKVHGSRAVPIFEAELPCILVYTRNETAEISVGAPREYKRSLTLALELVAQADTEAVLDDILDAFAKQVEAVMCKDETFGGVASDTVLGETEMDILADGKKPIGGLKITYTMPYYERMPADGVGGLVPFETANVNFDLPEQADDETEDTVELPQS